MVRVLARRGGAVYPIWEEVVMGHIDLSLSYARRRTGDHTLALFFFCQVGLVNNVSLVRRFLVAVGVTEPDSILGSVSGRWDFFLL